MFDLFAPNGLSWTIGNRSRRLLILAIILLATCQRVAVPNASSLATYQVAATAPFAVANADEIPPATFSQRVRQRLAQMTLEGKIEQVTQPANTAITPTGVQKDVVLNSAKFAALVRNFHIGSFLNDEAIPALQWVRHLSALRHITMRESRLHIPIIYGIDNIHTANYAGGPLARAGTAVPGSGGALTPGC